MRLSVGAIYRVLGSEDQYVQITMFDKDLVKIIDWCPYFRCAVAGSHPRTLHRPVFEGFYPEVVRS